VPDLLRELARRAQAELNTAPAALVLLRKLGQRETQIAGGSDAHGRGRFAPGERRQRGWTDCDSAEKAASMHGKPLLHSKGVAV
jgi:hypothetical protein